MTAVLSSGIYFLNRTNNFRQYWPSTPGTPNDPSGILLTNPKYTKYKVEYTWNSQENKTFSCYFSSLTYIKMRLKYDFSEFFWKISSIKNLQNSKFSVECLSRNLHTIKPVNRLLNLSIRPLIRNPSFLLELSIPFLLRLTLPKMQIPS